MRALFATSRDRIRAAYEAGLAVYTGTDAGGSLPHGLIRDEIRALVGAGIPQPDVIAQASWRAREWLGLPGWTRAPPPTSSSSTPIRGSDLATIMAPLRHRPAWRRRGRDRSAAAGTNPLLQVAKFPQIGACAPRPARCRNCLRRTARGGRSRTKTDFSPGQLGETAGDDAVVRGSSREGLGRHCAGHRGAPRTHTSRSPTPFCALSVRRHRAARQRATASIWQNGVLSTGRHADPLTALRPVHPDARQRETPPGSGASTPRQRLEHRYPWQQRSSSCVWARCASRTTASSSPTPAPSATAARSRPSASTTPSPTRR